MPDLDPRLKASHYERIRNSIELGFNEAMEATDIFYSDLWRAYHSSKDSFTKQKIENDMKNVLDWKTDMLFAKRISKKMQEEI